MIGKIPRRRGPSGTCALALLVALWVPGCFTTPAHAVSNDVNRRALTGEAIEGYDAVAYWTDGTPERGLGAFSLEWRGAIWRFSSAEHLRLFEADPEKYAPEYGGYCAYGIGRGIKADIHPYAWEIADGRLYLFISADARQRWDQERAKFEVAGQAQWAVLGQTFY